MQTQEFSFPICRILGRICSNLRCTVNPRNPMFQWYSFLIFLLPLWNLNLYAFCFDELHFLNGFWFWGGFELQLLVWWVGVSDFLCFSCSLIVIVLVFSFLENEANEMDTILSIYNQISSWIRGDFIGIDFSISKIQFLVKIWYLFALIVRLVGSKNRGKCVFWKLHVLCLLGSNRKSDYYFILLNILSTNKENGEILKVLFTCWIWTKKGLKKRLEYN